jgi:hypothetical protein
MTEEQCVRCAGISADLRTWTSSSCIDCTHSWHGSSSGGTGTDRRGTGVAVFASYAALAVANAAKHDQGVQLAAQMQDVMRTPAIVEQAKGILMARHRISAERAFHALVRAAGRPVAKFQARPSPFAQMSVLDFLPWSYWEWDSPAHRSSQAALTVCRRSLMV